MTQPEPLDVAELAGIIARATRSAITEIRHDFEGMNDDEAIAIIAEAWDVHTDVLHEIINRAGGLPDD